MSAALPGCTCGGVVTGSTRHLLAGAGRALGAAGGWRTAGGGAPPRADARNCCVQSGCCGAPVPCWTGGTVAVAGGARCWL